MDKNEFLALLRGRLTGRMEPEEMEKIISYYKANYDETQPERQRQVLEALGKTEQPKNQVHGDIGEKQEKKEEKKTREKKKAENEKKPHKEKANANAKRTASPAARPTKPKGRKGAAVLCVLLGGLFAGAFFIGGIIFRDVVGTPPQVSAPVHPVVQPVGPTVSHSPTETPEPTLSPAPTAAPEPLEPSGTETPSSTAPDGLRKVEEKNLDAFTDLSVIVDIENVTVTYGKTYALTMNWYSDSDALNWENENGVLRVWSTYSGNGKNRRGGDIQITIPEGTTFGTAKMVIGMGDIEVYDLVSEAVTAITGMGSCQLSKVSIQEVDATSGMGDIEAELIGVPQDYRMNLNTGMGKVKVNGEEVQEDYETEEGRNALHCSTGMGDVKISFF